MLSSPRARPFAYIERGMRSSIALRWAQNPMRADRRTRIVREMVRPHHSVPFGTTAPGQRFLAARCSNICDRMSRSSRRGQLFSSVMMMLIARACSSAARCISWRVPRHRSCATRRWCAARMAASYAPASPWHKAMRRSFQGFDFHNLSFAFHVRFQRTSTAAMAALGEPCGNSEGNRLSSTPGACRGGRGTTVQGQQPSPPAQRPCWNWIGRMYTYRFIMAGKGGRGSLFFVVW